MLVRSGVTRNTEVVCVFEGWVRGEMGNDRGRVGGEREGGRERGGAVAVLVGR